MNYNIVSPVAHPSLYHYDCKVNANCCNINQQCTVMTNKGAPLIAKDKLVNQLLLMCTNKYDTNKFILLPSNGLCM